MKPIFACLFYLCGVVAVPLAGSASAERFTVGIEVSERHGVHQDWLERNRFLYNVAENSIPDSYGDMRDRDITPPFQRSPFQRRQDQPFGTDENDDPNSSENGGNQTMNPSADVPDSVHGYSGIPGAEGDPRVRDLSGRGLSEPGGAAGALGR